MGLLSTNEVDRIAQHVTKGEGRKEEKDSVGGKILKVHIDTRFFNMHSNIVFPSTPMAS